MSHPPQNPPEIGDDFDFPMAPNPLFAGLIGRAGTAPLPEIRQSSPFEDQEQEEDHVPGSYPTEDAPRPLFSATFPRTGHNPFEEMPRTRQRSATNFNVLDETIAGGGRQRAIDSLNGQEFLSPYGQRADNSSDAQFDAPDDHRCSSTNPFRREGDREALPENHLRRQLVPEYAPNRDGSDEDARFEAIRQASRRRYGSIMTDTDFRDEEFDGFEQTLVYGADSYSNDQSEHDPENWQQAAPRSKFP